MNAGDMYVIANLAVDNTIDTVDGVNYGPTPGQFPKSYDIDYIRVYQKTSLVTPTIAPTQTPVPHRYLCRFSSTSSADDFRSDL